MLPEEMPLVSQSIETTFDMFAAALLFEHHVDCSSDESKWEHISDN